MNPNITLVVQGLAFFAVAWIVMKYGWPHIIAAIELLMGIFSFWVCV